MFSTRCFHGPPQIGNRQSAIRNFISGISFSLLGILLAISSVGCSDKSSLPDDARTRAADQQVRAKWGKGLSELPTLSLDIISANNENIRNEFEWAFSLHQAVERGHRVVFVWHSVGGGGNTINTYLMNVYKAADTSGIDLVWGGGDYGYPPLARAGILEPATLAPDVLASVPATLGGLAMYDPNSLWVGSALSAFGFVYNAGMLRRCNIAVPSGSWEDLGDGRFADLVELADPTQSGSAAAAYQTIVRSGKDWPDGWAKLMRVMANAKRFTDSAGTAANAVTLGDALVATCIDFYGAVRVQEAPDQIVYVSPRGQTAFTCDPIAILKNPPHRELAQQFVDFLMSAQGQALQALPVGSPDGPARSALGRQPIRKDVYETYRGKLLPWIVNPYEAGMNMPLEGFRSKVSMDVLKYLVLSAGVENTPLLRQARGALVGSNFDAALLADFNRLPENVDTIEKMALISKDLKDPAKQERIITDWQRFFRTKYEGIAAR